MSNMVVVRHPNHSGYYLFRVPEGLELDVDTLVVVETARGNQPAVCVTGTFQADPAEIVKHWGGGPVKRVLKVMREFALEWPEEPGDIVTELTDKPFGDDD